MHDLSAYITTLVLVATAVAAYATGRQTRADLVTERAVTEQGQTIAAQGAQMALLKEQVGALNGQLAEALELQKSLERRADQLSELNVALQTTNQELQRANHQLTRANREQAVLIRKLEERVAQLEAERGQPR